MKSPILLSVCLLVVPIVVSSSYLSVNPEKVNIGIKYGLYGINITRDLFSQKLECYQCTNNDENGQCAQGDAQQCEMRSLLRRFVSYLKAKFLGKPIVVPVCLRAEIQVGEKLVTRHSCAMVNKGDTLDETTCTSSLYMLGGLSGHVAKCELCKTDKCNSHKASTSQPFYKPYNKASALVRSMELGHVQHDVQSMRYTSKASSLVVSLSLLFSTSLLLCIYHYMHCVSERNTPL